MTDVLAVYNSRGCVVRLSQGSVRLTNGCALECGVGFRQLRTCRRTRPGQLCANNRPHCYWRPVVTTPVHVIIADWKRAAARGPRLDVDQYYAH